MYGHTVTRRLNEASDHSGTGWVRLPILCVLTATVFLTTGPGKAAISTPPFEMGCTQMQIGSLQTVADTAIKAFADNCFSPFMTAAKASQVLALDDVRYDFYDLDPFSRAAPSPVTGRALTPDTDRRCEVSFDFDHARPAAAAALAALHAEGILSDAPLPATHSVTPGTELLAARHLNPKRIAVVHVGTRPGPNGIETYLNVERLTPSASQK